MKYIKIFLASSIVEFKEEREDFGTFIRRLNNIYAKRNIYFDMFVCEDISKELSARRSQDRYNDEIKDSRYFYIIIGKNLGDRSLEEFDIALESFISTGFPLIMTYFYEIPEGGEKTKSVTDFMNRLETKLSHDYNLFSHFDSIKLDFLMGMHQDPELQSVVSFSDGSAIIEGEKVMELDNVPIYGKNASLQELKQKKAELDKQFAEAAAQYAGNPDDDELYKNLTAVSEERARIADTFRKAEADVLSLCLDISDLRCGDNQLTWREKEAIRLTNQGDYEGALAILRDKEREKELEFAEAVVDSHMEVIKGYIKENLLRIKTLKAQGMSDENVSEIDLCYDEVVRLALKYGIETRTVYDYISFLLDKKRNYDKAIILAEKVYNGKNVRKNILTEDEYYEIMGYAYLVGKHNLERGIFYYEKAVNYYEKSFFNQKHHRLQYAYDSLSRAYNLRSIYGDKDKAIEYAEKSLQIAERHNGSKSDLISANILLATMYNSKRDYETARVYAEKAYSIALKLHESFPADDYYLTLLARTLVKIGDIADSEKNYKDAIKYYNEALIIRKRLYENNPYTEKSQLAYTYGDFGNALMNVNKYEPAVVALENAVLLGKDLCVINPQGEERFHSNSLQSFGIALSSINRYQEAAEAHREAMQIRRRSIDRDDVYTCDVLFSTRALADDLSNLNQNDEAERLYKEAIDLAEQCAAEDDSYSNQPRISKRSYAWFLKGIGRLDEAGALANEILNEEKTINNLYSMAWTLNCLGCIQLETEAYPESEKTLFEALEQYKTIEKPDELSFSVFYHNIALCYYEWGKYDEADRYASECCKLRKGLYMSDRDDMDCYMLSIVDLCGNICRELEQYEESEQHFKEAVKLTDKLYGICPDAFEEDLARVNVGYAKLLLKTNRIEEANDLCSRAVDSYRKLVKTAPQKYKKENLEANEVYLSILKRL